MTTIHFMVPAGIDDPARPSGGNVYDRQVSRGLKALGWPVRELHIPGSWPLADVASTVALAQQVSTIPDRAVLMVDGMLASASAAALVPAADRLALVVVMHLPLGAPGRPDAEEGAVLTAAAAVITTSEWSRRLLLAVYPLTPQRVSMAEPGVDPAPPAVGTASGRMLLCVAAVAPHKGQDVLVDALAALGDLDWCCVLVGALDLDPAFVRQLRRRARAAGIGDRLLWAGPLTGAHLAAAYAAADLLVLASHGETYGMVVAEGLARGLPVVATEVGGVPAVLGEMSGGRRPGLLVPPGDAVALAEALRAWLADPDLRQDLRMAGLRRRQELSDWAVTSTAVAAVVAGVAR